MQSNGKGSEVGLFSSQCLGLTGNPFTIIAVSAVIIDTDASVEFIVY